jgi:hypothetical protein
VGDREILETYLNSASKNTSKADIFPHGPKSLLTSVIGVSVGLSHIFLMWILDFKILIARRLYKSFGVKELTHFSMIVLRACWCLLQSAAQ